jgi:hypothetical protein
LLHEFLQKVELTPNSIDPLGCQEFEIYIIASNISIVFNDYNDWIKYLNTKQDIVYFRYFRNSSCVVLACSIIDFMTPTFIGSCLGTVKRLPSECFSCI